MSLWLGLLLASALGEEPPGEGPALRWAALPIVNYSSDLGVGYGAYGTLVRPAPEGVDAPYRVRLAAQIFRTTGGYEEHFLRVDLPHAGGPAWRWDLLAGWESWDAVPYFGIGNRTPRLPLDETPDHYYAYDLRGLKVLTNLRRRIDGPWELFATGFLRQARVAPYTESLLDQTRPEGVYSGVYTRLGLGLMHDTRDLVTNPRRGVFSEASVYGSAPFLGSNWTAAGVNLTDRRFIPVGERMVLASRALLDMRVGEEPFFIRSVPGGSQWVQVGGGLALRGLPLGRYRGDGIFLWTPELRVTYASVAVGNNRLELLAVPFVDLGRVWLWEAPDEGRDSPLHLHQTAGVGARFVWNDDMVARLDVGVGREELLDPEARMGRRSAPNLGIYLLFEHPY